MNFYIRWFYSTLGGLTHQEKYCGEWDKTLNVLIDRHWHDAKLDRHTIKLGDHEVWISNAFYSYGHIWGSQIPARRPSVQTMGRLDSLVQFHKAKVERLYVEKLRGIRE